MLAFFAHKNQECTYCGGTIYVNTEAEMYEDLLFCDDSCAKEYLYNELVKTVNVTNDKFFRSDYR